MNEDKTLGEICAGIGGFGLGFEQAGWKTIWQIELDDVNRTVLADRFPDAAQFKNIRDWRSYSLPKVSCIAFGFPCQDLSLMANVARDKSGRGLAGQRSGLFFPIMEIVRHLRPEWVAIENVPALLSSNNCEDFQAVIRELALSGYVGFWRVLNAQYFGVPQRRKRLILVAGLGRHPSMDFLADAQPVENLPSAFGSERFCAPADAWAGYTLTAPTKGTDPRHGKTSSRYNMGSELFIAEENGWDQMLERQREIELHGLRSGLDAFNLEEAYAAGNAFPPPMAKWIAEILNRS